MAVITAAFNPAGATNGSTILAADAGDLSAWNVINTSANQTYDNTRVLFGKTLGAKMAYSAAAGFVEWTTSYGSPTEDFGRLYVYFDSLPTTITTLLQVVNANGFAIFLDSSHKLRIGISTGGGTATSTTTIATGQWYRLEYHTKTGVFSSTLDIYTSPDSSTSAETLSASATYATANAWALGCTDGNHTLTYHVAQVAAKGTAAIGPYPVNTVAPGVTGSTPVGSTLTCDGGTWNGTFTLTYQWTQDGVNIGGATSSTYQTVSGDATHAIGCKVTATGVQATNEAATQASGSTVTVTAASTSNPALSSSGSGAFLRLKGLL